MADARGLTLTEIELACRRSARHVSRRRRLPRRRGLAASRSLRAIALAVVLLALVAESAGLESSNAKSPGKKAVAGAWAVCPVPARFRSAFVSASEKTGVPVSLLVATAYEESRMNPAAQSGAGARGLLQVMPATAQSLRAGDSPAANVLAGARYLRQMLDRFRSVELALAAYTAGPTAVARAGAAPTIATLRYVKNVEARASLLADCR